MHRKDLEAEFERVTRHWTRWMPKGVLRRAGFRRLPGPILVEAGHTGGSLREVLLVLAVCVLLAAGTVVGLFLWG